MGNVRFLFTVLATALVVSAPAAASTIAEWGQGFEKPVLAGAGIDAAGKKLTFGHLELSLSDGRLIPVRVLDTIVGAYFTGRGTFRYVSADPIEAATYRENIKRATPYQVDDAGGFGDSIRGALVFRSATAADLAGDPSWAEGEPPPAAVESFRQHLADWAEDEGWRYDEVMPQALLEPPKDPFTLVQIDAEKIDLVHVRDTLRHHDEDIFRMWKSESTESFLKRRRFPDLLSEQPIGRKRLDPRPAAFRLIDVDGTLINAEGIQARVSVRETIEARLPQRILSFELADEWFGTTGATAEPTRNRYTVEKLTDAAGNPLPFRHTHGGLTVELPKPLAPGEKLDLHFELGGEILFHPGNDSYWSAGDGWFPSPGRRDLEAYTYHAVAKVKKPFVAFSSGATVKRWEEDDLACVEFRSTAPLQGAVLLAGKYTTYSEERKGLTVRVSAYVFNKPEPMKKLASLAFALIEFYQPLLGEYPWKELDIIEINSYGFGVAPPGVIYITKEAFVPGTMDEMANFFIKGINSRIAHEIAHAWWGNVTLLGPSEENWMWEATADYFAAFAMGNLKDKGEFDDALRAWKRGAKESTKKGSVLLANQLAGKDTFIDRTNLLYAKGPLILHALRLEVGDKTFFTIMKSFQRSFRGKSAYTKDLIGITNFITKKDYTPFFERYLMGTEMPEIK